MLHAIYTPLIELNITPQAKQDKASQKTFSISEFKNLSASQITLYRHSLICPVCLQVAYFRRASKDGKQACFGSRYHLANCSELTISKKKEMDEIEQIVEKSAISEEGLHIDFSFMPVITKPSIKASLIENDKSARIAIKKMRSSAKVIEPTEIANKKSKQNLAKLLTSLSQGSSLAASDVWVYTSEQHKWRAKNLFVNIADAQVTDNGAPRLYWGTIGHVDKDLLWLNPIENRSVGIPIKLFQQALLQQYSITEATQLQGAGIILFAKCIDNKDKSRKFLQLWSHDVQYLHLVLVDHKNS